MGVRVIAPSRVHDLGYRLVRHELQRREGDSHAQCGRVRDIEGGETLVAEDLPRAVWDGFVH